MNNELIRAQIEQEYAAKMQAQKTHDNSIGSTIGSLNRAVSAPADFQTLLGRIRQATMEAREAAGHASNIADTMHGSFAEVCGAECARDRRNGLIGQYEDAIEELFSAINDARSSLRRISNGIPDTPKSTLG